MNREQREVIELMEQAQQKEDEARRGRILAENRHHELVVEPEIRKAIGTCYRYRNGYSSGEHWWLYMQLVAVKDGEAVVVTFQTDTRGALDAKKDTETWPFRGEYERITEAAFRWHWLAFKQSIAGLLEVKP